MELVTRGDWGAQAPRGTTGLDIDDLRGMAVHYTAMDVDRAPDHATCDDRVRSIQRYHQNTKGWDDIAYNFLTCQHGSVFEGRGWGRRSAANGTNPANNHYHAACFLGGDVAGRDDVTDTGRRALKDIIEETAGRYSHAWEVRPHSDFKSTACPGHELRSWIRAGTPTADDGSRPADMPPEGEFVVVNAPPVALMGCASGGYWIACADGGVFNFGGAGFHGSLGGIKLNAPIVDMASSPTGAGYILFGADGGVFVFGDAEFSGSMGDLKLNKPIVDAAITSDGTGYWMLGEDGGIFAHDAPFEGRIEYRG